MKPLFYLLFAVTLLGIFSCESNNDSTLPEINCEQLSSAVLSNNDTMAYNELEKICSNLNPTVTSADPFGHRANINRLLQKLNTCQNLSAELICYACIYTYPPQSEILITVDSSGTPFQKVFDIVTSEDSILSYRTMHGYNNKDLKLNTTQYKGCFIEPPEQALKNTELPDDTVYISPYNDSIVVYVRLAYNCCGILSNSLIIENNNVNIFIEDICKNNCQCWCICNFQFEYNFTNYEQKYIKFNIFLKELNKTKFTLWDQAIYEGESP